MTNIFEKSNNVAVQGESDEEYIKEYLEKFREFRNEFSDDGGWHAIFRAGRITLARVV